MNSGRIVTEPRSGEVIILPLLRRIIVLVYTHSGPVQTSNFSCTEPNVSIKYMKSSTYESIRIGRFEFGSTVPFYPTGLAG